MHVFRFQKSWLVLLLQPPQMGTTTIPNIPKEVQSERMQVRLVYLSRVEPITNATSTGESRTMTTQVRTQLCLMGAIHATTYTITGQRRRRWDAKGAYY